MDCKSFSAGDRAALNMHPCISCASILHSIACNCFAISPNYGQTGGFLVRSLEPVLRQRCSRRATVAGSGESRATRLTTVSGKLPTYGKCFRGISATALTLTYPDLRTATRLTASLTERTYTCESRRDLRRNWLAVLPQGNLAHAPVYKRIEAPQPRHAEDHWMI